MGRKKANSKVSGAPAAATAVVLRLYIANGAPNSLQAVANLAAICKEHPQGSFEVEIIDVLTHPLRALDDGIVVTPSLSKMSPAPPLRIVGNLSDTNTVLHALGLAP